MILFLKVISLILSPRYISRWPNNSSSSFNIRCVPSRIIHSIKCSRQSKNIVFLLMDHPYIRISLTTCETICIHVWTLLYPVVIFCLSSYRACLIKAVFPLFSIPKSSLHTTQCISKDRAFNYAFCICTAVT